MRLINALAALGSLPAVKLFKGRHRERTLTVDSLETPVVIPQYIWPTSVEPHSLFDWSNATMQAEASKL